MEMAAAGDGSMRVEGERSPVGDVEEKVDPESPEELAKASGRAMDLSRRVFQLGLPDAVVPNKAELQRQVLSHIEELNMAPYYEAVCATLGWEVDGALLERMKAANAARLAELDAAIADAREKHGEVEVAEAVQRKAAFFGAIGDKEKALEAYRGVPEKALSTGQKIDIAMAACRLGFFHGDEKLVDEQLALAKRLNEKGGDWDRRNRLKVYEGVLALGQRDTKRAAALLLDSVATFTAVELLSYSHFIFYAALAGLQALERPALRKRVIDSPDVLSVLPEIPHLGDLLSSFYEGRYGAFLGALSDIAPFLSRDRALSAHTAWLLRELRINGYVQFLEAYRSVTLAGMARAFAVPPAFLDRELARFIAAGRVHAKIDAVAGVIETTRPDTKNAQYQAMLKQGDALLNKITKLARVVSH